MTVVAIVAQKGGPGKSTLTQSVAAIRAGLKHKCAILDLDDQETTYLWSFDRAETRSQLRPELPHIPVDKIDFTKVTKTREAIAKKLDAMLAEYKDVFIDVGGKDTDRFRAALIVADRVVVPMEPGKADLNTIPKLIALLDELEPRLKRKIPISAVLNKTTNLKKMVDETVEGMKEFADRVPLLPEMIGTRSSFKVALAKGLGVHELKGKEADVKAALETKSVYLEIFGK